MPGIHHYKSSGEVAAGGASMRPSHHGGAPAAASPAPPRATSSESVPLLRQTPNRAISQTGAKAGAPEQQFETLEFPPRCNAARSWARAKPIGTRRAGGEESIPATNPPKNRARGITPCKKNFAEGSLPEIVFYRGSVACAK